MPRAYCDAIKGPIRIGSSEMRISAEDEDYTRKCCADDEVGEVEGEGMSSEICMCVFLWLLACRLHVRYIRQLACSNHFWGLFPISLSLSLCYLSVVPLTLREICLEEAFGPFDFFD